MTDTGLPGICDTTPSATGRLTEDSAARIDRLQTLLNRRLGPEFVSQRQGGGGNRISYIEGWRVINLANEVFGYNGWFSAVKDLTVDFMPDTGRYCIGVSAIVRVWLRDGASHEDIGYGKADNVKLKSDGLDKAKKEAVTDALKRALRNFGNLLGNCLYDKAHIAHIQQIKPQKVGLDWNNLHRADSSYYPEASTSTMKPAPTVTVKPVRPTPAPTKPERVVAPARAQTVAVSNPTPAPDPIVRPPTSELLRDSDDELFAGVGLEPPTDDSGFVDGVVLPAESDCTTQAQEDAEKAMRKLIAEKKQAAFRKQRESAAAAASAQRPSQSPEQSMRPPNAVPHRGPTNRPTPQRAQSTVVTGTTTSALPAINVGGAGARMPTFQPARNMKRPESMREPLSELDVDETGDIKRVRV